MESSVVDGVKQGQEVFFSIPSNKETVIKALSYLKRYYSEVKSLEITKKSFVVGFLISFLSAVDKKPGMFDENCRFNIDGIGDQLLRRLDEVNIDSDILLDELVSSAYRFVLELKLVMPGLVSEELSGFMYEIAHHEFSHNARMQIIYAEHQMVVEVVSRFLHHPDMVDLKRLPSVVKRSEEERALAERMLTEQESRVLALKNSLEKYEAAYNFVGLYDGFKMLRIQKKSEGRLGLTWLSLLGMLMLAPFVFKFYTIAASNQSVTIDAYAYASVLGFELLLAYFFRVGLHGYRAVKAQLIQIDLRMALCQFIQNYAVYAKDVRRDSPELLDRFDQLIFSGIVNNEGAIPSTFDGIEQIANVLDKLKSK
ncbi:hypothetical protein [Pseudomonas mosselii]|uniref:hypothetical protein n=1 Tax=Pseudomonas mosselii TaxID=78327 RepID=UPI00244A39B4|nr:hypothetical protein [Pseudomonas mosselii]MDH1529159.1 hypothetical protein [Pseudomonas mosselii]